MQTLRRGLRPHILMPATAIMVVLLLSACGGSRSEPPAAESDWEVRVESPLDTVDVPGGEDTAGVDAPESEAAEMPAAEAVPEETVRTSEVPPSEAAAEEEEAAIPDARTFTPGWRVQIAALSSMAGAEEVAARARERLQQPVYVEYEPPLYKVRVGDFLVREEAESMKTRAIAQDFAKAWVVETW